MKMFIMSLVFLASTAVSARECIRSNQIRNFDALSSTELLITTNRADYIMTVDFCPELPWAHKIGFESFSGLQVCRGDRLLILDNFSSHVKTWCWIRSIKKDTLK